MAREWKTQASTVRRAATGIAAVLLTMLLFALAGCSSGTPLCDHDELEARIAQLEGQIANAYYMLDERVAQLETAPPQHGHDSWEIYGVPSIDHTHDFYDLDGVARQYHSHSSY
jgi:hypothetical protein